MTITWGDREAQVSTDEITERETTLADYEWWDRCEDLIDARGETGFDDRTGIRMPYSTGEQAKVGLGR